MKNAVEVIKVHKVYESTPPVVALKDISLAIKDNEFLTLLGPSGCGKTTLLRIIAGFEEATLGDLRLFGDDIAALPPEKRPVNTVFQNYSLFPHMSVAQNIAFGLQQLKQDKDQVAKTVREMLELVKLSEYGDRNPSQLSGGQQQRVALARALAPHPKVLLLDEPLSALDLKLRQAMRLELKDLQRRTGITFVFVTHDQEEALTMSDRIVVMSQGEIQQIGTPAEIYENPTNRFVADFVGESNFFIARVTKVTKSDVECQISKYMKVRSQRTSSISVNDVVTLFLRPEKISLLADPIKGSHKGIVRDIVYLGDNTDYQIELDGAIEVTARAENRSDGTPLFAIGSDVHIHFDKHALKVIRGEQ
ncbi:MAG: spermidine/putrescine ABC transporter ATP-binding protein [Blastopirellula sp.]|nr:MAG: spermidine/putrescine ABC transporter ATP-binding protein [Blastopirellula sp.]